MAGKVIGEAHHAVGARAAAAAGDRDLSRKAATGQGARAGCNAVFTESDGVILNTNSGNHENLRKIERRNIALKGLVEIREEVGIYLNAPLLRGWHGNVEVRARSRLKRSDIVAGFALMSF